MQNEKNKPQKAGRSEAAPHNKINQTSETKMFIPSSRCARPKRWVRLAAVKAALCQIPNAFAFLQNEKPKWTKKAGARRSRAPQKNKLTLQNFDQISEAKKFVANSCCAACRRQSGTLPNSKGFSRFCKTENSNQPKKREGRSFAASKTPYSKINKIQFFQCKSDKKNVVGSFCARPKRWVRLATIKTAFCQIPNAFAFFQKKNPNRQKKRGAASLRLKPRAEKSINFKFVRATRAKKFVASSCFARPLRRVRAFFYNHRSALGTTEFDRNQFMLFCENL